MKQRVKAPASVKLVQWLSLGLALVGILRLAQTIQQWTILETLLPVSPWYFALSGLAWGCAGLLCAWGCLRRWRWTPWLVRITALAYVIYYWTDRLLVADLRSQPANQLFMLGLTALALAWIFWIFTRPQVKTYFGEAHDQHNQQQPAA